jgi:transcriptional regulator with XRE-family HTH domain
MVKRNEKKTEGVSEDDSEEILRIVAQRLQETRIRAGLSQTMLAERAGVKQTYVYEFEYGTTNFTIKTLDKLSKALNIDIRDLFPGPPLAGPTGGELKHLYHMLDTLVSAVKEHLSDEKLRAADDRRRSEVELDRRRKSEAALLTEIQKFAELRDGVGRVVENLPTRKET